MSHPKGSLQIQRHTHQLSLQNSRQLHMLRKLIAHFFVDFHLGLMLLLFVLYRIPCLFFVRSLGFVARRFRSRLKTHLLCAHSWSEVILQYKYTAYITGFATLRKTVRRKQNMKLALLQCAGPALGHHWFASREMVQPSLRSIKHLFQQIQLTCYHNATITNFIMNHHRSDFPKNNLNPHHSILNNSWRKDNEMAERGSDILCNIHRYGHLDQSEAYDTS